MTEQLFWVLKRSDGTFDREVKVKRPVWGDNVGEWVQVKFVEINNEPKHEVNDDERP